MIKDIDNLTDTAIVFYKGQDLMDFKSKSMPLAATNEYQCHYSALVRTVIFDDESKQHFVFPLIYYNYKQEVGGADIDFEMKDVIEKAKEVQEASIPLFKILKAQLRGLDENKNVKYSLTLLNNIHKHP